MPVKNDASNDKVSGQESKQNLAIDGRLVEHPRMEGFLLE
jgi:hypothetical protein